MGEHFKQDRDYAMKFTFVDDHEVNDVKVDLNEMAYWSYSLVLMQFTHKSFTQLSPHLSISLLFPSLY